MPEVLYGVEGATDVPVAEKLIRWAGFQPRPISTSGGKSQLQQRLSHWNSVGNSERFLVLRDWDHSDGVDCVPELLNLLLRGVPPARRLVLRVPVRATESWLMADREAFKEFFNTTKVPVAPDDGLYPKQSLVNACRSSRSKRIRQEMVPRPGSGRAVGPQYTSRIIEFALTRWDPDRASQNSPSLERTLRRLEQMVTSRQW